MTEATSAGDEARIDGDELSVQEPRAARWDDDEEMPIPDLHLEADSA